MKAQQALVHVTRWDSLFPFPPNRKTKVVESCDHLQKISNNTSSDFDK